MHSFPQLHPLSACARIYKIGVLSKHCGVAMLFATVSRGRKLGTRLVPHRFKDNRYRVQLGKEGPYIPLADYREIPSYLANGYSLLMSNKAEGHTPSLIKPQSIHGWCTDSTDLFFPAL
jgi:hypothetical protein